jgi:hypothetical protein
MIIMLRSFVINFINLFSDAVLKTFYRIFFFCIHLIFTTRVDQSKMDIPKRIVSFGFEIADRIENFLLPRFESYCDIERDPRTEGKIFLDSSVPTIVLCGGYFIMVIALKWWMTDKKAFDIRLASWFFNVSVFLTSIYFVFKSWQLGWFTTKSWKCEFFDRSNSDHALASIELFYHFFLFKFCYMAETVIFLLGKRDSLISNYHLIHHGTLPLTVWFTARYYPTGHSTFVSIVNPSFHVILFGYLTLVSTFPQIRKYTKNIWKPFWWFLQVSATM